MGSYGCKGYQLDLQHLQVDGRIGAVQLVDEYPQGKGLIAGYDGRVGQATFDGYAWGTRSSAGPTGRGLAERVVGFFRRGDGRRGELVLHSGKGFPAIGRRSRWLDGEEEEVRVVPPILLVECGALHGGLNEVLDFGLSRKTSHGRWERLLDMGGNALHRVKAQGTHCTQVGQNRAVGDAIVVEWNLVARVSVEKMLCLSRHIP